MATWATLPSPVRPRTTGVVARKGRRAPMDRLDFLILKKSAIWTASRSVLHLPNIEGSTIATESGIIIRHRPCFSLLQRLDA